MTITNESGKVISKIIFGTGYQYSFLKSLSLRIPPCRYSKRGRGWCILTDWFGKWTRYLSEIFFVFVSDNLFSMNGFFCCAIPVFSKITRGQNKMSCILLGACISF